MLDLGRLSAEQRRAVLAPDGPLLVEAGPGSGKTTVLAARVAYLVAGRGVAPSSVLALTFTGAAARELRSRLLNVLGEAAQAITVATLHALGLRIVRQWSAELGLGPGPVAVYDAADARALLGTVAGDFAIDAVRVPLGVLAREVERFRLGESPTAAEPIPMLARAYEALLARRGAVDYAAMLALPLRLLVERPSIRRLYQDAYRHVVCDEAQDLSAGQYALVRALAERHRNVVLVGDPMQAVYGWRGADGDYGAALRRDFPDLRTLALRQNFRSTARIVALANALGAGLGDRRGLWTANPPGERARLHAASAPDAEAAFVASTIERLCAAAAVGGPGEAAVLFRTNEQAEPLAAALRARGVRYRVRGGGDLFGRREVRDALAYLRLTVDASDHRALARVVDVPPRRLGRLAEALRARPAPLAALPALAARIGSAQVAAAERFVALVERLRAEAAGAEPAELLDVVLERTGYRTWLAGQADGPERLGHLASLRGLAARAGRGTAAWLAEVAADDDGDDPPDERRVVLSTVHRAKGGEWRAVFVTGLEEGLMPHARALDRGPAASPTLADELRVAYVALTRAREHLYLTYSRARRLGGRELAREPSRFLRALPPEHLTRSA